MPLSSRVIYLGATVMAIMGRSAVTAGTVASDATATRQSGGDGVPVAQILG